MAEVKTSKKGDIVKVILALVAVLLGTYMFVEPGKSTYTVDPVITNKIDSLQKVNDTLKTKNLELDSLVDAYKSIIYDLDYRMSMMYKTKQEIEDYYRRRNRDIQNSTQDPSDLDTFFMNRYEYVIPTEE